MDLNGGSTLAEGSRTLPRGSSSRGRAWWAKQGKDPNLTSRSFWGFKHQTRGMRGPFCDFTKSEVNPPNWWQTFWPKLWMCQDHLPENFSAAERQLEVGIILVELGDHFQPHLGSLSPRMNGLKPPSSVWSFQLRMLHPFCQDRIPGSLAILAGAAEFTTETAQVCWDTAMVLVVRLARALAPLHCAPQTALWETCVTLDLPWPKTRENLLHSVSMLRECWCFSLTIFSRSAKHASDFPRPRLLVMAAFRFAQRWSEP